MAKLIVRRNIDIILTKEFTEEKTYYPFSKVPDKIAVATQLSGINMTDKDIYDIYNCVDDQETLIIIEFSGVTKSIPMKNITISKNITDPSLVNIDMVEYKDIIK